MSDTQNRLLDVLKNLTPSKFKEVVVRYGISESYLSIDKPQVTQAIEVLRDAESCEENLQKLLSAVQACQPLAIFGNTSTPLGLDAYRHCDREDQDNHFCLLFDQICQSSHGEPQFYLTHGEEGECHHNFIRRLCDTHIKRYAHHIFGQQRTDVFLLQPVWSDHAIEVAEQYLSLNLLHVLREQNGEHIHSTTLTETLRQLLLRHSSSVVVLCYNLAAQNWHKHTPILLQRYYDACRTACQQARQTHSHAAHCLVFINVVYPSAEQLQSLRLWQRLTYSPKRVEQAVYRWQQSLSDEYCCQIIEKLTSVTWHQAKTCFEKIGLHEEMCLQRLKTIFGSKKQARMAVVEAALYELIQQLQQDAL